MTTKLGRDLKADDAVRVVRRPTITGIHTELDTTDWGDRAVVVDAVDCGCSEQGCRIVTVAEDTFPGSRTTIHVRSDTAYPLHPPY